MGHTFSCQDFTSYVLKAVPKETIKNNMPADPQQPFKSEVDANNYLTLFYDSKSSGLDFKKYFLEFREFPVDESGQNEVSPSKEHHPQIESEETGPVDSESEEEKCVHLDLGQSEESDEEEDDKKKLVLMGFEKMKFNLDSTEFEALWKEMQAVERLQLYADLFEHLAVLHEVGVIHCDLKPDNIMNIYADSPKTIDADSGDITQADNSITTIKKTSLIEGKEVTIRRIPFKFIDFGLSQARNLEGNQDPICHFSNPTYTLPMINQKGGLQRMKGSFVVQDIYSLAVSVNNFEKLFAENSTSSIPSLSMPEKFREIIDPLIESLKKYTSISEYTKDTLKNQISAFGIWTELNNLAYSLGSPFALTEESAEEFKDNIIKVVQELRPKSISEALQSLPWSKSNSGESIFI